MSDQAQHRYKKKADHKTKQALQIIERMKAKRQRKKIEEIKNQFQKVNSNANENIKYNANQNYIEDLYFQIFNKHSILYQKSQISNQIHCYVKNLINQLVQGQNQLKKIKEKTNAGNKQSVQKQLQSVREKLCKQLNLKDEQIKLLHVSIQNLKQDMQRKTLETFYKQQQLQKINKECVALNKRIQLNVQIQEGYRQEITQLNKQLKQNKDRMLILQQKEKLFQSSKLAQKQNQNSQLVQAQIKIKQLRQILLQNQNAIIKNKQQLKKLQVNLQRADLTTQQLNKKLLEQQQYKQQISNKLQTSCKQIYDLKTKLEKVENNYKQSKSQSQNTKKNIQNYEKLLTEKQQVIKQLTSKAETYRFQSGNLKQKLIQVTAGYAKSQQQRQEELQAFQITLKNLEKGMDEERQQYQIEMHEMKQKIRQHQLNYEKLKIGNQEKNIFQVQLQTQRQYCQELQSKLLKAKEDVEKYKEKQSLLQKDKKQQVQKLKLKYQLQIKQFKAQNQVKMERFLQNQKEKQKNLSQKIYLNQQTKKIQDQTKKFVQIQLQQRIKKHQQNALKLQQDLSKAQQDLSKAQQKLNTAQVQLSKQRQKYLSTNSTLFQQVSFLNQANQKLQKQNEEIEKQKFDLLQKIKQLSNEVNTQKQQFSQLKTKLDQLTQQNTILTQSLKVNTSTLQQKVEINQKLQLQIQSNKKQLNLTKTHLIDLEKSISIKCNTTSQSTENQSHLKSQIERLSFQISILSSDHQRLMLTQTQQNYKLQQSKLLIKQYQKQLDDIHVQLQSKNNKIIGLQNKKKNHTNQTLQKGNQFNDPFSKANSNIKHIEMIQKLTNQLTEAYQQINILKQQINQANQSKEQKHVIQTNSNPRGRQLKAAENSSGQKQTARNKSIKKITSYFGF